jgi:hypothetical protein
MMIIKNKTYRADQDFDKKFNSMMRLGKIAVAFWIALLLSLCGGIIWVVIHFVSKFW